VTSLSFGNGILSAFDFEAAVGGAYSGRCEYAVTMDVNMDSGDVNTGFRAM
jgi:hypothetical protein